MNVKRIVRNISIAFGAQVVACVASTISVLLLPKILGVEEYGYWQLFLFYGTYVGCLQFGLIDGIYLIKGGQTRDLIDKNEISLAFRVFLSMQLIAGIILFVFAFATIEESSRVFVLGSVSVYILLCNITSFWSYTFQTMDETKLSSLVTLVDRSIFLVMLFMLLLNKCRNFEMYIVAHLFSRLISCCFALYEGRDLLCAKPIELEKGKGLVLGFMKVGLILTFSSLASRLVIGASRITIDHYWGIEMFSKASLALSIISFFLVLVAQVGMVLFPALRRVSYNELLYFFSDGKKYISLILPLVYLLYFPIKIFLIAWLPEYTESVVYLGVLLPIVVYDTKMNIFGITILKVVRKERQLLLINIVAVLFAATGSALGVLFDSVILVLLSATVAITARSVVTELYVSKLMAYLDAKQIIYDILLSFVFISSALIPPDLLGLLFTAASYVFFLAIKRSDVCIVLCFVKNSVFLGKGDI